MIRTPILIALLYSLSFSLVEARPVAVEVRCTADFLNQEEIDSPVFIVRHKIDLCGNKLIMPYNSVIVFKNGGSVINGIIVGNNTIVEGGDVEILRFLSGAFSSVNIKCVKNIQLTRTLDVNIDNVCIDLCRHYIKAVRSQENIQPVLLNVNNVSNFSLTNGTVDGGLKKPVSGKTAIICNAIRILGSRNISISKIIMSNTGGYHTNGPAMEYCSMLVSDCDSIKFNEFTLFKSMTEGVIFHNCSNIHNSEFTVNNNYSSYGWTGLHYWYCRNIVTQNAIINVRPDAGSGVTGYVKDAIYDNVNINGGHGIQIYNEGCEPNMSFAEENILFKNCSFNNVVGFGIMYIADNGITPPINNIRITNCFFHMKRGHDNMNNAIRLGDGKNIHIEQNYIIFDNTEDVYYGNGILFTSTPSFRSQNILIKNNIIKALTPISVEGMAPEGNHIDDIVIDGNIIESCYYGQYEAPENYWSYLYCSKVSLRGLKIEGNTFSHFGSCPKININSVFSIENSVISDNTFVEEFYTNNTYISAPDISGLIIWGNTIRWMNKTYPIKLGHTPKL